jgi:hypothetical protein
VWLNMLDPSLQKVRQPAELHSRLNWPAPNFLIHVV